MANVDEYRRLNTRKASILSVGGFRPTFDPLASNFGTQPMGLADEVWPAWESKPLLFVCQLNLSTAPAVPPLLQDIKLITFFVKEDHGILAEENGTDWCLRAYKSLDGLVPTPAPLWTPKVKKGFECRWEECEDHPNSDDPDLVPVPGVRRPRSNFENVIRTKAGGYASTLQSEPWWDLKAHACQPKYCFQVNSEEKAGFSWGDGGTAYIARGTAAACQEKWFLDWQCL
jgi:uncharacterized protein YwqG